jgi:uncharacterized protein
MTPEYAIDSEDGLAAIVAEIRTVAVVGMKNEKQDYAPAYLIPRVLQACGIRVLPVNPTISSSLGETSYPNLSAVPTPFDTVNVFRKSEFVGGIADEILSLPADRRPKLVWMQTGIRNAEAAVKLTKAGIAVVMDRCLGVYVSKYRRDSRLDDVKPHV